MVDDYRYNQSEVKVIFEIKWIIDDSKNFKMAAHCTLLSLLTLFLDLGGVSKKYNFAANPTPPPYINCMLMFFNPFVAMTLELLISSNEINIYQNITHITISC